MPASLGPKPAGCTDTLTITMVQQLLFISSSTLPIPTPDHTLTHRTPTTLLTHIVGEGGRGGREGGEGRGGNFFLPPVVHTASLNLVVEQLRLPASTGGGKKNKTAKTERKKERKEGRKEEGKKKERKKKLLTLAVLKTSTRQSLPLAYPKLTNGLLPTILSPILVFEFLLLVLVLVLVWFWFWFTLSAPM